MSLCLFILSIPLLRSSNNVEYEEIKVYDKAYILKGDSKLNLDKNGYFKFYPQSPKNEHYEVGVWTETADSIELKFKEYRKTIIDQALSCEDIVDGNEGLNVRFYLTITGHRRPLRRLDVEIYDGTHKFVGRTNEEGIYTLSEINRIQSILIPALFGHENILIDGFTDAANSITITLDYHSLMALGSNSVRLNSPYDEIEGKWAVKGRFLIKKEPGRFIQVFRKRSL